MLNENDVVEAVCAHLLAQGYVIDGRCSTSQKGTDVIASRDGIRLHVEAKGATSSKATSKRYGKPFDANQSKTHVAVALLRAMELKATYPREGVAIAFPRTKRHENLLRPVAALLSQIGIQTMWVELDRSVTPAVES